jgi:hypothetical protein
MPLFALNEAVPTTFAVPSPQASSHAAAEWRAYLDADDDLPAFCPDCAEGEFGSD